MARYNKIFAALDGGATQEAVVRRAFSIAHDNGAEVLFGHVIDSVPYEANGIDFAALIDDGHKLILWSVREGELLQEAVDWCRERGVRFHAVNGFFDEDSEEDAGDHDKNPHYSRKLKVECFIDDRNVGGLPDWGSIYQIISRHITYEELLAEQNQDYEEEPKKKPWWKF